MDRILPNFTVKPTSALAGGAGGAQWVRFSLPLAEGQVRSDSPLAAVSPSGAKMVVQTRPLATWGDGSVRWLECQAIAREPGTYALETTDAGATPADPVMTAEGLGTMELSNGIVAVTLGSTGASPVAAVLHREVRVSDEKVPLTCTMATTAGKVYSSVNDAGRTLRWLFHGPVSARAEVAGKLASADGGAAMSYRLRVQLFAGLPVLSLSMWILHEDPGVEAHDVAELTLSTAWLTPRAPTRYLHQNRYSTLSVPRDVTTERPVEIRGEGVGDAQIRVHNTECLEDTSEYPYFMGLPVTEAQPLLGLSLQQGWVACRVGDFIEKCPKGLVSRSGDLSVEVWPRWAGAGAWRQGKSRAIDMKLVLGAEGQPTLADVRRIVSASDCSCVAAVPPESCSACREFRADTVLQKDRAGVRRIDRYLSRLMQADTPIGMWDLGDTREPGYSRTYAAIGRLKSHGPAIPARFKAGSRIVLDWSNPDQFEAVWSNNEYDVIICMAREIMRGNDDPDVRRQFTWFARHAIEVDFIHYSDHAQLHHGSPAHSVTHDHASAYPSHLWSEGLLAYYCLSGDDDALDVAVMTGDYIIDFFADPERRSKTWRFSRELGWALLHVATLADITREERFRSMSLELADVLLDEALSDELVESMVRFSFGYASLVLGMEAVTLIDDSAKYRDWIVAVADAVCPVIDEGQHGVVSSMNYNYLVPAYEITGDRRYLETGRKILEVFLDSPAWHAPFGGAKDSAMKFRGLARFVHHAHNEGLLDGFEYEYAR